MLLGIVELGAGGSRRDYVARTWNAIDLLPGRPGRPVPFAVDEILEIGCRVEHEVLRRPFEATAEGACQLSERGRSGVKGDVV